VTWTYTHDPINNQRDAVRVLIGDTDECDPILQDEEINFFLNQWSCPQTAAIESCLAIGARYARKADENVGQVRVSFSQISDQFYKLADRLKVRQNIVAGPAIAGGISKSDKRVQEDNDDRVQPAFTKELHDNERVYPTDEADIYEPA